MSDFSEIEEGFRQVNELFKEADMARAYIDITAEHGPSAQLLAFVNHDKSLSSEIGLEAFDNFSLQTQHEILLSKLKPDVIDQMATEGFVDTLKKWDAVLVGAGASVSMFTIFSRIGLALIVAGSIGVIANAVEKLVPAYKEFTSASKEFDEALSRAEKIVSDIPLDFKSDKWTKFSEALDNTRIIEPDQAADHTKFASSGWNESNFSSSAKYLEAEAKKLDELNKKCADAVKKIEDWASKHDDDKETLKLVSKSVPKIRAAVQNAHNYFNKTTTILKLVSHCFEAKK